ncbi:MAG: SEC-C metal-binding domain-containing protein, partial [Candidatus Eremiobacteraeota bacterium]|nr:SEC-C metal-binding domain-containing protein [Candidatus Eremiobacteraeota bacterium]
MEKRGRNDACPCGSGKKYKRCCLGKEEARRTFSLQLERDALPLLRELGRFAATRTRLPLEKVAAEHFPFWHPPLDQLHGARLLD